MALITKSQEKFVSDMIATLYSLLQLRPTLKRGSVFGGLFNAISLQMVLIQGNIEIANGFARAQTSNGPDLDSWMAQFGFTRLPSEKATGTVTFSLLSARTNPTEIPVGSQVQVIDGSQVFEVIADSAKPGYNEELGVYVIQTGQLSVDATVVALLAGPDGNAQPGRIVQIVSGSADLVNNSTALAGGRAAESDDEFRARFVLWINSRSRATRDAVLEAALSVKAGLDVRLSENKTANGTERLGYFTVIIDDGTGSPPNSLKQLVYSAVDKVRGFTIEFIVVGPVAVDVEVTMQVNVDPDFNEDAVLLAVQEALYTHVNNKKIGESLYLSALVYVAMQVPGVQSVEPNSVEIDNSETDKVVNERSVIRAAENDVTVTAGGS